MPCLKSGRGPFGCASVSASAGGGVFSAAACACCVASRCPPCRGSSISCFCAIGSWGFASSSNVGSLRTNISDSSGRLPSTGVCAALSAGVELLAAAAPAPLAVAAAGPPILIPSLGLHVWSLGNCVPGDVCLAWPVAGCWGRGGGGVCAFRAALGAVLGGGGRGGLLELEAWRMLAALEGIMGDAWRRGDGAMAEGRMALSAARGSIFWWFCCPSTEVDYSCDMRQTKGVECARDAKQRFMGRCINRSRSCFTLHSRGEVTDGGTCRAFRRPRGQTARSVADKNASTAGLPPPLDLALPSTFAIPLQSLRRRCDLPMFADDRARMAIRNGLLSPTMAALATAASCSPGDKRSWHDR